MKKTLSNAAVLFSLALTLVVTGGVATMNKTVANASEGIDTCSDLWFETGVED